jgi:TRAP-type C4-dicarboxylate transport system permease small subunit
VVLATVVSLIMIKAGYDMVWNSSFFGVKSGTWLRIPLKWPQMVLIVGPVLLFVQMIAEVIKAIRIALDLKDKT